MQLLFKSTESALDRRGFYLKLNDVNKLDGVFLQQIGDLVRVRVARRQVCCVAWIVCGCVFVSTTTTTTNFVQISLESQGTSQGSVIQRPRERMIALHDITPWSHIHSPSTCFEPAVYPLRIEMEA